MNPDSHYTYIYYDPSHNNEPIYIGKGFGKRVWTHINSKKKHPFIQRLQFMKKAGIKPIIGIYSGLDEEFSLLLETELIQKFGRKDLGKGSLLNLTDGGEGSRGARRSEFHKKKLSELYKDKPKSDYHKKRISESTLGVKKSEEHRKSMSISRLGRENKFKGKCQPYKGKYLKISTPDGIFNSVGEVSDFYKIKTGVVYQRCYRNTDSWKILKEK